MTKQTLIAEVGLAIVIGTLVAVTGVYVTNQNLASNPPTVPFDFALTANQATGVVVQGKTLEANMSVSCVQGSPEIVSLCVSSGLPDGASFSFFNATGIPAVNGSFSSTLQISVPLSVQAGNYSLNITATASGGQTHSIYYTLRVLDVSIKVSGTVTADADPEIIPSQIAFINKATGECYNASVNTTPSDGIKFPLTGLVQMGRYSIYLPNHQNYDVVCTWVRVPLPGTKGTVMQGTFPGGILHVDCNATSTASMTDVNYHDYHT